MNQDERRLILLECLKKTKTELDTDKKEIMGLLMKIMGSQDKSAQWRIDTGKIVDSNLLRIGTIEKEYVPRDKIESMISKFKEPLSEDKIETMINDKFDQKDKSESRKEYNTIAKIAIIISALTFVVMIITLIL